MLKSREDLYQACSFNFFFFFFTPRVLFHSFVVSAIQILLDFSNGYEILVTRNYMYILAHQALCCYLFTKFTVLLTVPSQAF